MLYPTRVLGLLVALCFACGGGDSAAPRTGGAGGGAGAGGAGGAAGGAGGAAPRAGQGGAAGGSGAQGGGGEAGKTGVAGAGGAGAGGAPGGGPSDANASEVAAPADGAGGDAPADGPPLPAGNPFVYVGNNNTTEIRIYELDLDSGALMARGSATSGQNPHYMAFHPSGRYAYALSEVAAGRVYAFAVNPDTGALTRLNDQPSGGNGPAHIGMHRSGKWLLSSNYISGHAAALPILEDGRLGPPVMPRQAGAQAHMILDDRVTGGFVFVPSKGDNRVLQFRLDEASGVLMPNTPAFVAQGGAPRHMAFHPSGRYAYLLTEAGHTVVSYRYDQNTGLLSGGQGVAASPNQNGANGSHILVHPRLDVLYASIRGYNSIAVFTINGEGRAQNPVQVREGIATPWDFDIDPTGQYLVMGNFATNTLRVYRINQQTGALTVVGNGASGPKPRFVGIMPRPPAP